MRYNSFFLHSNSFSMSREINMASKGKLAFHFVSFLSKSVNKKSLQKMTNTNTYITQITKPVSLKYGAYLTIGRDKEIFSLNFTQ